MLKLFSKVGLLGGLTLVWMGASGCSRARSLHQDALVFDAHIHAIEREFYHGGDIGQRKPDGQFDLPRAREGGVGAMLLNQNKHFHLSEVFAVLIAILVLGLLLDYLMAVAVRVLCPHVLLQRVRR